MPIWKMGEYLNDIMTDEPAYPAIIKSQQHAKVPGASKTVRAISGWPL